MEYLEEHIRRVGTVAEGNILKVDNFLNHLLDVEVLERLGAEFARLFSDEPITKILTIESSGIAIAYAAAAKMQVPVLFAKKTQSLNVDGERYVTKVESFTKKTVYDVFVSSKFLGPDDHVLIIDDFLANGCAALGLIDLLQQAGATLAGVGIAIEKGFQEGGKKLRAQGYRVESLAIVESMDVASGDIVFGR